MNKNQFYQLISRIFDPIILLPIGFVFFGIYFELTVSELVLSFLIQIVSPILYLLTQIYRGKTDIDVTKKEDRIPIFAIAILCSILTIGLNYYWENFDFVEILARFLVINIILICVTFFWKISGHALTNTLSVLILTVYVHEYFLVLLLIMIPLIFKSRMHLEKHTMPQLIAGSLLSFVFFVG